MSIAIRTMIFDIPQSCLFAVTPYTLAARVFWEIEVLHQSQLMGSEEIRSSFDKIDGLRLDVIKYDHHDNYETAPVIFSLKREQALEVLSIVERAGLKRYAGHKFYPTANKLNKLLTPYFKELKSKK